MSEIDFEALNNLTTDDVMAPEAFPVGTFNAVITEASKLASSQKGTPCIAFGVEIFEAVDADPEELEAFGDWQGYKFRARATVSPLTFWLTDPITKSLSYLIGKERHGDGFTGFIPEILGKTPDQLRGKKILTLDEEGAIGDCVVSDCIGSELMITIGHEESDNGRTFAVITDVSPKP